MKNDMILISNGIYTLKETENESQFCFSRNDGRPLQEIGQKPLEFYYAYLVKQLVNKQVSDTIKCSVSVELVEGCRYAIISARPIVELKEKKPIRQRKMNIIEKLYWKLFW